ncbi:MAG TPA: hypothetical protein VGP26_08215 [Actinophytocola sp.]|jgi:hypothetical protein|nr:hypothetical protein [Actinophytocola sp.]
MNANSPRDKSRVAAICAMLAPYSWRKFTPEWLARWVLTAHDRHDLADFLGTVSGAEIGPWSQPRPADAFDPRLPALVEFLASNRWPQLSLPALCDRLLAVLHKTA